MTLQKMITHLEEFDKARGGDRYNQVETDQERVDALQTETLYLLGELGEFANELKKCRRDTVYKEQELQEEAADMFIFLLKITKILNMDLEKEFTKKMDRNEERFKHLIIK